MINEKTVTVPSWLDLDCLLDMANAANAGIPIVNVSAQDKQILQNAKQFWVDLGGDLSCEQERADIDALVSWANQ